MDTREKGLGISHQAHLRFQCGRFMPTSRISVCILSSRADVLAKRSLFSSDPDYSSHSTARQIAEEDRKYLHITCRTVYVSIPESHAQDNMPQVGFSIARNHMTSGYASDTACYDESYFQQAKIARWTHLNVPQLRLYFDSELSRAETLSPLCICEIEEANQKGVILCLHGYSVS